MRNQAYADVTFEDLAAIMDLPEGHRIIAIRDDEHGKVRVVMEGPLLPPKLPYDSMARVNLHYHKRTFLTVAHFG